jgi:hypothetical protein
MSSDLIWPTTTRTIAYTLTNISYGNNMYIALTGTSTILYSLDNITWNVAFSANIIINSIVFLNNLFIAVGQPNNYTTTMASVTSSNLIITSSNGIDWTYRSSPAIFALSAVAYGNNTFVIVGTTQKGSNNPNYLLTSTNGVTWTLRYGAAENPWKDITYGNGKFIAVCEGGTWGVGPQGKTMISTDNGVNWSLKAVGNYIRDLYWHKIIYANGYFVSVSKEKNENCDGIMISQTGENYSWFTTTQFSGSLGWSTVTYDGTYFYITGSIINSSPKIYRSQITSTTPTWTEVMNIPQTPLNGNCFITYANKQLFISGSSNYLAVSLLTPIISNFIDLFETFGNPSFDLSATSDSPGLFSYSSLDNTIATIVENKLNIIGAGTTVISVLQVETDNFLEATKTLNLTVYKAVPIISNFLSFSKTFGDSSFDLSATSSSPAAIIYSSSNTEVASVSGRNVTIVAAGLTVITLSQSETPNYLSKIQTLELTVNKATPIISNFIDLFETFGNPSFELSEPISDSPGLFSYSSSNTKVVSIIGKNVTIVGAGIATITATQAETDNYLAEPITCLITIHKRTTILSNFSNLEKTFGDNIFTLSEPISDRMQFI